MGRWAVCAVRRGPLVLLNPPLSPDLPCPPVRVAAALADDTLSGAQPSQNLRHASPNPPFVRSAHLSATTLYSPPLPLLASQLPEPPSPISPQGQNSRQGCPPCRLRLALASAALGRVHSRRSWCCMSINMSDMSRPSTLCVVSASFFHFAWRRRQVAAVAAAATVAVITACMKALPPFPNCCFCWLALFTRLFAVPRGPVADPYYSSARMSSSTG